MQIDLNQTLSHDGCHPMCNQIFFVIDIKFTLELVDKVFSIFDKHQAKVVVHLISVKRINKAKCARYNNQVFSMAILKEPYLY